MFRTGRELWRSLLYLADAEPPKLVEFVMLMTGFCLLLIALVLLGFFANLYDRSYVILAMVLAVGSSVSSLVRESMAPSVNSRHLQIVNKLLLGFSLCALWVTLT